MDDILVGLLGRDPDCRRELETLALEPSEARIMARDEPLVVRVTLRNLALALKRSPILIEKLRASARAALYRDPLEPISVARTLLESARQIQSEAGMWGTAILDEAENRLKAALAELSGKSQSFAGSQKLLLTLSKIYKINSLKPKAAKKLFDELKDCESLTDPEMKASLLEAGAGAYRRDGLAHSALPMIEQARRILEGTIQTDFDQERFCEALLEQGIILVAIGRGRRAVSVLDDARSRLNFPHFPGLRHEFLFYLALAEYQNDNFSRARKLLTVLERDNPWHLEHRRFQLLAEMDRKEHNPSAEAHYARSLSACLAQERGVDAARILSVLVPLAVEHKGIGAIAEYRRFVEVRARTPGFCGNVADHLRYQLHTVDPDHRDIALRTLIEKLEDSVTSDRSSGAHLESS